MTTCKVCRHAQLDEIDACLVSGESERNTASRFHLTQASVHRHKGNYVADRLAPSTSQIRPQAGPKHIFGNEGGWGKSEELVEKATVSGLWILGEN